MESKDLRCWRKNETRSTTIWKFAVSLYSTIFDRRRYDKKIFLVQSLPIYKFTNPIFVLFQHTTVIDPTSSLIIMALQLSLRRSSGLLNGSSSSKLFSTFRSGNVPSSVATAFHHHGAVAAATFVPQQLTMKSSPFMAFTPQQTVSKRWATTAPMDLGDVIGIDLGTTNSCVCVMVR